MEARREKAVVLYVRGDSVRQVARQLNVSHTTIERDLDAALDDLRDRNRQEAQKLRALYNKRWNRSLWQVWPAATKVESDEEGRNVPVHDDYALCRALSIMKSLRRINGVDLPPQTPVADQRRIIIEFEDPPEID